jgi:asparagine synthase (glutamine-hydrolysing)
LVANELRKLNLIQAHRECRNWSRFACVPYVQLLMNRAMPLAWRSCFPLSFRQPAAVPPWLAERYRKAFSEQSWNFPAPRFGAQPSFLVHLDFVNSLFSHLSAGYLTAYRSIHFAHPYSHRPLVEFCLSLPISQLLRDGQTRSLMRRALKGLLPREVLNRKSKGSMEELLMRAFQKEWPHLRDGLNRWELCRRGFVDPKRFHDALHKYSLGLSPATWSFSRVFSMERWLRSLDVVPNALNVEEFTRAG